MVRLEASKPVESLSVTLNGTQLGPISVSRFATASFGPMASSLPAHAVVRWLAASGENREQLVAFPKSAPRDFDALTFFIEGDDRVAASFVVRIGGWRDLHIPFDETPEMARLRGLNESLHIAASRGQFSAVRNAVEAGADVNYLVDTIYPSPVRTAANGGHRELVDYLLLKGARVKQYDLRSPLLAERMKEMGRQAE